MKSKHYKLFTKKRRKTHHQRQSMKLEQRLDPPLRFQLCTQFLIDRVFFLLAQCAIKNLQENLALDIWKKELEFQINLKYFDLTEHYYVLNNFLVPNTEKRTEISDRSGFGIWMSKIIGKLELCVAHYVQGRNPYNIWFIWVERWLHCKVIKTVEV